MGEKEIEVKVSVLKSIYSAMMPLHYRLNSLLEDVVVNRVLLSETDRSVLLDYCSCSGALKVLFEDYFERFSEINEATKIILPYKEYITIMSLSRTVEHATKTTLGGLSIQDH